MNKKKMAKRLEMNTALVNAIYQYITIAGLNDVALALRKQCEEHKIELKPVSEQKLARRDQIIAQKRKLLSYLEKDECEQFFKRWNELFEESIESAEVISLEFYIRLYFATLPLRKSPPNRGEYQERIEELKKFLEDEGGAKYSANVQLVQYFALPYVAEPGKHPVFKEIVQKKWARSIQENLNAFLTKQAMSIDEVQDALLQKWMTACQSQHNELMEKEYHELQDDYYRIVEIINEMFGFMEQSSQGKETVQLAAEYVAEIKTRLAKAKADAEQHMQNSTAGGKMGARHRGPIKKTAETKKKDTMMKKSESIGNLIPSDPNTQASPKTFVFSLSNLTLQEGSDKLFYSIQIHSFSEESSGEEEKQKHEHDDDDEDGKRRLMCEKDTLNDECRREEAIVVDNLIEQLNYTKIGNCLIKGASGRLSCLLLQALRQVLEVYETLYLHFSDKLVIEPREAGEQQPSANSRITRTSIKSAEQVLRVYANNDLLLLKHLKNSMVSVITSQGDAGNDAKEELARLLNSIASFNSGRNYLLATNQGKQLIASLTIALKTKKLHDHAGEHVLATLQKLSIRPLVQKELVQLGMVEWLSLYLGSKPSAASLDYGSALLLNLCLNPFGKSAASRAATIFIATIANLMADRKLEVCNYINGVLYTVLGVGRVKARAREVNLASIVKDKLDSHHCKDDERQLPIIYKILNGDLEAPLNWRLGFNEIEEGQEIDYVEAEVESTDTVEPHPNELFGEQLLIAKFRLADTLEKPAPRASAHVDRDEITAPPGTVPRSQTRRPLVSAPRGTAKSRAQPVNITVSDANRPDSVSSQQTFVLENSRRRPLVARDPFKYVLAPTLRKAKSLTKESYSETTLSKTAKKLFAPMGVARDWSPKDVTPQEVGAADFLPDAPVASDASVQDYSAVFESKPKLPRTPVKCAPPTVSPPLEC